MDRHAEELHADGFTWVRERFAQPADAFAVAGRVIDPVAAARGLAPLGVVGDFVVPPVGGGRTRDFQTLHFDFGLPLDPKVGQDVAHFAALHVPTRADRPSAVTRLVPLPALLGQRSWPRQAELTARLAAYGRSHGAWDDSRGYVEGSLARLIEAAAGGPPALPSVKTEPGFLCGTEFNRLEAEVRFFAGHGLTIADVAVEIPLAAGELLVFDNAAVAHGRRGVREPGELHQRAYGHRQLDVSAQRRLRDRVLATFSPAPAGLPAR